MPEPVQPARYRFGSFELLPSERRLLDSGEPAAVGPRAFDLLVALVEHRGQLVSKDEILKRVWPGLVVEEGNLQVQVSKLRKVLGTEAIETVAGHGYRFTPPISADTAVNAPQARRHNLPRELTSFVGREGQVAEQKRRLAQARLLTITGGGGLGKSRFSLQLAAGLVDDYADGVWLVELAAVADPRHVTAAFAAVLGVADGRGGSLRDAVVGYVRDRSLLLVVDNCEHVLAPVAELAKLVLQVAPLVKLIATSREPLHVAGEVLCPLSPLEVPEAADVPVDDALGNAAIRLFVARASASQPAFRLTPDNVKAVASICRQLEGIPLALELAAARVRSLSIDALAERLTDRFKLLSSGDRTALPRHQTLRGTIEWSYDLLSPDERELMNRLSAFAGGFDLEAAEAMGGCDDVLEAVSRLVDKSLVIADPDHDRYSILETVREYMHERLAESGRASLARDAHLAHFLAIAEAVEPELIGPDQATGFARISRDRENFLAAHAWCAHAEDGARRGLRLVGALRMFWQVHGPLHLGYRVTTEALARPGAEGRDYARCQALLTAGSYAYFLGRYVEAHRYADACAAIAREQGDAVKTSDALVILATVALAQGETAKARDHIDDALSLARAAGDAMRIGQALNVLGEVHSMAGEHEAAEAAYEECLAMMRRQGEHGSVAGTLVNLARTAVVRGSLEDAGERLMEAAQVIEGAGAAHQMQLWLAIASSVAAERGEPPRAAMLAGAFAARSKAGGYKLESADEAVMSPRIAKAREAIGELAFDQAFAAGAAPSDAQWLAEARDWLGAPPR